MRCTLPAWGGPGEQGERTGAREDDRHRGHEQSPTFRVGQRPVQERAQGDRSRPIRLTVAAVALALAQLACAAHGVLM